MSIWKTPLTLEQLNQQSDNTLVSHLGIEMTELGDDYLVGTLPVDPRTHQPFGILHGGASVVLAETLGSTAANLAADPDCYCVGLEINANHLSSMRKGTLTGTARAIHVGRSTQVWEIQMHNDQGKAVCISRLTMAVLKREAGA
ncbi:hotdog fold thioesterase [Aestuariirhabdus litorea]|uniref:Hotdog fold thioesterase n=1 Tax=Aestuariirhabdus litorea TaxID=2528527 RepID=A0A3P3VJF5_9GAMM|nr:hotdog fold thioesterase [Aestuariirhabdus litorea]RRJ82881.1 hotdog fold thioesterase [Aestuariirhabdus litorea]RWW93040.1 hotdog fold thioesterase [Endozoicomonadaceae bacterium GTF-13]